MFPTSPGCSDIRPGLDRTWFGRFSAGLLVLDGCFVALSVAASVSSMVVVPVTSSSMDEIVVDSTFVVVVVPLVSSELQ